MPVRDRLAAAEPIFAAEKSLSGIDESDSNPINDRFRERRDSVGPGYS